MAIEQVSSLLEFFREELTDAFGQTGVKTSEETEAYLVHLLDSYSKLSPEAADDVGFSRPAAKLLEEALHSAGERRIELYRRLGDASLYSCGFFTEHLSRRTVNASYYEQMGQTAYHSLHELMSFKQPGSVFAYVYDELAAKFGDIVEAFRFLGEKTLGTGEGDMMDQLGSGKSVDLEALLATGLLPTKEDLD